MPDYRNNGYDGEIGRAISQTRMLTFWLEGAQLFDQASAAKSNTAAPPRGGGDRAGRGRLLR
jgi:hypothetical protein